MLKSVLRRVGSDVSVADSQRRVPRLKSTKRIAAAGAVAALCLVQAGSLTPDSAVAKDNDWPAHVSADYTIAFNGINIGGFKFKSSISGRDYVLDGDAELSALLGAFNWRGVTRASGNVGGNEPQPAGYTFTFKSTVRSGSVKLGFSKDRVSNVSLVPPIPEEPDEVPLEKKHLDGALDPLTAVMALTRPAGDKGPCDRVIPIFDGKQRFDLRLSYSRQEPVREIQQSGQPGIAIVCSVRYVPIGGYSPSEAEQMAENTGIEVSLRPVPSANLFVPHEIRIPTIAGSVTLTSARVDIMMSSQERIALVY